MNKLITATLALSFLPVIVSTPGNSAARAQVIERYSAPYIDDFTVRADRLTPGSELVFSLEGTPNAKVRVMIGDGSRVVRLREVQSGYYEGSYTIRTQDRIKANTPVRADLQSGNQSITAVFGESLLTADNNDSADDYSDVNIDRERVTRNRPTDNSNTPNSYNTAAIPFNESFPLEVLSHENNSRVGGNVELRGMTAPNAIVTVNVTARNNLIGNFGFERQVINRTVKADERGNFSVSFQPSGVVPGTVYRVNVNASNGEQNKEESLTLLQE